MKQLIKLKKKSNRLFFTIVILVLFYLSFENLRNSINEQESRSIVSNNDQADKTHKHQKIPKQKIDISTKKLQKKRPINSNFSSLPKVHKCEKWIIITTINQPTWHLKYINDASYGWCLVVVGDKKTPKDWKYRSAIYLSVDDQILLSNKFQIINSIPFNSYLRKIVGYLFAIDNGAKYIYETDDDNSPLDGLFGFRYKNFKGLELNLDSSVPNKNNDDDNLFINPYSYFGQPSVWPRGFPLEKIGESTTSDFNSFKLYTINDEQSKRGDRIPLIQQGLVNGDPDVDAIYRLTRKNDKNPIDITFDENTPPLVLSKNQYAPINSQNTFYHYDAFWSLVFPLHVTFRECDILRGYISLRLLQEINGRVSFMPPNAIQIRNAHSYKKDYKEEKKLYENVMEFVKALHEWKCTKDSLKECLIDCILELVSKELLSSNEVDFYQQWIDDLELIGYNWPKIERKVNENQNTEKESVIYYKSIEQKHSSNSNENESSSIMNKVYFNQINYLEASCSHNVALKQFNKCIFNKTIFLTSASSREELHDISVFMNIHFTNIIICYREENNKFDQKWLNELPSITIILSRDGFRKCVKTAFRMGFKLQSFVIAKDYKDFQFWQNEISFKKENVLNLENENEKDSDEKKLTENMYFIRRNVGNGQRIISLKKSEKHMKAYCDLFKSNKLGDLCETFQRVVNQLNWHNNDLASESCDNLQVKTVWIPDFHDGPRVDITSVLAHLGQNPILNGYKGYMSPYPEAIQLGGLSGQRSNFVSAYSSVSIRELSEESIKENFEYYKSSSDFQNADIVICSFLASMCEAFIPLNRTIIFNPAHRYNIGRCSESSWKKLNDNYHKANKKSKLIVSSMSKYDGEYQAHFTGLRGYRLYAFGGYYAKNVEYNPTKDEILVGPSSHLGPKGGPFLKELNSYAQPKGYKFVYVKDMYQSYTLQQLANHRAFVIFPYAVMTYSIIDFYISKIPLFLPSMELLNKWKNIDDRKVTAGVYCGEMKDIPPANNTIHKYTPNDDADEPLGYWLQYADYFHWPFVTTFDSWEDLINKLNKANFRELSNNMKRFNSYRETDLLDNWCKVIKKTSKPVTPKTYEEALKYFEVDRFQV